MKKQTDATGKPLSETRFSGMGVSEGIAIGPVFLAERGTSHVPEYMVIRSKVEAELTRFQEAVDKSLDQLDALKARVTKRKGSAAEDIEHLLDVHIQMLSGSRLIRRAGERIKDQRLNAEAAVQSVVTEFVREYANISDSYLAARIHDIEDVGERLIRNLRKAETRSFSNLPRGSIIISEDITPADTALMEPGRIGGFVSELGGAQSHAAIMARSLGLPAVLGISSIVVAARTGQMAILDGRAGRLILNPQEDTIAEYKNRQATHRKERRQLYRVRKLPSITTDGIAIKLQANVELPAELDAANANQAEGIGLLRSEFMFMNTEALPGEDEQADILSAIVKAMNGRSVTIRTLDIGGDKLSQALSHELNPQAAVEDNPALGLRAIRLSLKFTDLLDTQLAAILRAGQDGPIRILLPMIMSVKEVRQVRARMKKVATQLRRRGFDIAESLPPLGVMIEVPAAAIAADILAQEVDFFSVGSNDLTQYTLAVDRGNEQVAQLYNTMHPAVLRLIQRAAQAALRAGIPINICGEMAGDERYTALLLGLGIRDLSMSAGALSRVKRRIRDLEFHTTQRWADAVMLQSSSEGVAAFLNQIDS